MRSASSSSGVMLSTSIASPTLALTSGIVSVSWIRRAPASWQLSPALAAERAVCGHDPDLLCAGTAQLCARGKQGAAGVEDVVDDHRARPDVTDQLRVDDALHRAVLAQVRDRRRHACGVGHSLAAFDRSLVGRHDCQATSDSRRSSAAKRGAGDSDTTGTGKHAWAALEWMSTVTTSSMPAAPSSAAGQPHRSSPDYTRPRPHPKDPQQQQPPAPTHTTADNRHVLRPHHRNSSLA